MRVGILGGTFDPPHLGHLVVAQMALEQLVLEEVLFVPTGQPWMKTGQEVTAAYHRLAMVRLAVEENAAFRLSDMEVRREGPSYAVDTLEELRRARSFLEMFFIVGEDAVRELPRWRQPQRLLELCTLAVYRRPATRRVTARELTALGTDASRRAVLLKGPRIGISATDLRERVAKGLSLRYLVPPAVEEYIQRHGLYAERGGG